MIIKELIANVNAFIRNKDFDELIKFLNRPDVNIGNVENNFNYYIHDINMDNVFKYAERVNGTWQLKEIKEEKATNNHSCFCKNCVPSPACELEKVKKENLRIIKQNKDLQRESGFNLKMVRRMAQIIEGYKAFTALNVSTVDEVINFYKKTLESEKPE